MLVPVLFGVSLLVFGLVRVIPGDVVDVILGPDGQMDPARAQAFRDRLGLTRPLPEQYARWAVGVLHGDLGVSARNGRPILPDVTQRLPVTLELTAAAVLIAMLVGVPLGVLSAVRNGSLIDTGARIFGLLGLSMPNFWLGTLLVLGATLYLRGVYRLGWVDFTADPLNNLRVLTLPAVALGLPNSAVIMRMTRSAALEMLHREYVVTARAKGLGERVVLSRHVLRNTLIPIVTVIGIQVGYLLGGAVIVEVIFAIPGLGQMTVNSIVQRDYEVLQAATLFIAATFVLVNLAVDLLYGVIDPRIRYS